MMIKSVFFFCKSWLFSKLKIWKIAEIQVDISDILILRYASLIIKAPSFLPCMLLIYLQCMHRIAFSCAINVKCSVWTLYFSSMALLGPPSAWWNDGILKCSSVMRYVVMNWTVSCEMINRGAGHITQRI